MEFFIVLIIGVFVIAAISAGSKRKEEIDSLKTQISVTKDCIKQIDNFLDLIDDQITTKKLKESSYVFLTENNVNLYEPRARRYAGYSGVRVAKGIYIGGSTGKSVQEQTLLSTGKLILYVDELVYSSTMETRTIKLNNIVDTELFIDGIRFSIKNRQKPIMFTGTNNSAALYDYINLLKALTLEFKKTEWNKNDISNAIDNMKTQYQDHLNSIEKELTDAEKK